MTIVIFADYVTKKEFFLRNMESVPRKDQTVEMYHPYTHVTEYLVRHVSWELVPNELPTATVYLYEGGHMPIIIFVDYVTQETIAHRVLNYIPRKGEKIHIEFDNLSPADYYVHHVEWGLVSNSSEKIEVFLEK